MTKSKIYLALSILLGSCSQIPDAISPQQAIKTKGQTNVEGCIVLFNDICRHNFDDPNKPLCRNVAVGWRCTPSSEGQGPGSGGEALETTRQFRIRNTTVGNINFTATYKGGALLGFTSTRPATDGKTYTFNGYVPNAYESGDGSVDFIADITLTDSNGYKDYWVYISYDANDGTNIAQVTQLELK